MGAQHLPKRGGSGADIPSPFCSVVIYGDPLDTAKLKTRTVSGNGFNPVWDEAFSFELQRPETAILYIAGESARARLGSVERRWATRGLACDRSPRPAPRGGRDRIPRLLCRAHRRVPRGLPVVSFALRHGQEAPALLPPRSVQSGSEHASAGAWRSRCGKSLRSSWVTNWQMDVPP